MSERPQIVESGGAKPIDARLWRERVNAVDQYVHDYLYASVKEGYRTAPLAVQEAVGEVREALMRVEHALYKIDKKRPAVGGEITLVEDDR